MSKLGPCLPLVLAALVAFGGGPALADPLDGQSWRGDPIPMGGTAQGDAMAGAAAAFRQVASAWRANDSRRATYALAIARRWLAAVPRPEVAALDERAARLADEMAMRTLDVAPAAEILARDATLISERLGGSVPTPWATTRPAATPPPAATIVAPPGAPGPPLRRPPGMLVAPAPSRR